MSHIMFSKSTEGKGIGIDVGRMGRFEGTNGSFGEVQRPSSVSNWSKEGSFTEDKQVGKLQCTV